VCELDGPIITGPIISKMLLFSAIILGICRSYAPVITEVFKKYLNKTWAIEIIPI
jgi:hypothetical protein